MSTKPDTETGWSREWPDVSGFYWAREHPHDDTPILVEVRRNRLMICGEAIKCDVREAFEASEFLGPISPSDFEQLIRLRKLATDALRYIETDPVLDDDGIAIVAALREALANAGEES